MRARHSAGHDLVVLGGGLVGLATSTFLARQGLSVLVIEAYDDPRAGGGSSSRSIGLTLCTRGLFALDALGLGPSLGRCLVPVTGRCVHLPDGGTQIQRYDLVGEGALYSIRRARLLEVLHAAAEEAGVRFQFRSRCTGVEEASRRLLLLDPDGGRSSIRYGGLICADGARSVMRTQLGGRYGAQTRLVVLAQEYREIHIPAETASSLGMNSLHVWPRGEHFAIALPNADGSFCATVFMPCSPSGAPEIVSREQARAFFEGRFRELLELAPDCEAQLIANPVGRMLTVDCSRWSYPNNILIVGDAAHAMPPYLGQGVNCAFEGCELLARMAQELGADWDGLFREFEQLRRRDVAAIWELSHANRVNLSRRVAEQAYWRRREIDTALQQRWPERFMPIYAMLAFSTLPYADAYGRAARDDAAIERLTTGTGDSVSLLTDAAADEFTLLPPGTHGRQLEWLPAIAEAGGPAAGVAKPRAA